MDVISDDCYPDPNDPESFRAAAFQRDLVRSLKPDVPWLLMEQATNALNWRPSNAPKAPGQMAALSAQAIGRGADGILFFQWRQSRAGAEKFHSAMLPHAGTDTRTWREAVDLGAKLAALPALPAGARDARVALVFDWENWWAIEHTDHPRALDYVAVVQRWYRALHRRHVQVDIVPPERVDGQYALAIAPLLYLLRDEGAAALTSFVERRRSPARRAVHRHRRRVRPVPRRRVPHAARRDSSACASRTSARSSRPMPRLPSRASARRDSRAGPRRAFGERSARSSLRRSKATDASVEASFTSGRRAGHAGPHRARLRRRCARYLATIPDEAGTQAVVDHVLAAAGVEPVCRGPAGARRGRPPRRRC